MVLATMQEQSVMVPVSALRLLSNSVHAIREALDKLIVMDTDVVVMANLEGLLRQVEARPLRSCTGGPPCAPALWS